MSQLGLRCNVSAIVIIRRREIAIHLTVELYKNITWLHLLNLGCALGHPDINMTAGPHRSLVESIGYAEIQSRWKWLHTV